MPVSLLVECSGFDRCSYVGSVGMQNRARCSVSLVSWNSLPGGGVEVCTTYRSIEVFDRSSSSFPESYFSHLDIAPLGELSKASGDMGQLAPKLVDELRRAQRLQPYLSEYSESPRICHRSRGLRPDPKCLRFLLIDAEGHRSPSLYRCRVAKSL